MPKSSHLEFSDTDSEVALGHLDSLSLPSEPPDIGNWFSSYVYESPDLDELHGFQDSDGAGETCPEEEVNGKSGNNHRIVDCDDAFDAAQLKLSHGIESESLQFSEETPDIRNWFSSYVYESPPLDTACDFTFSDDKEMEDGKLYVREKNSSRNKKDLVSSINVEKTELCTQMDTSNVVVKGPSLVEDAKLDHQSACKDDDDGDLLPLSSTPSLLSSDKVSETMLSKDRGGYSSHDSLEQNGSALYPASVDMKNKIGSRDGKPNHSSAEGGGYVEDSQDNEDINASVSPRTTDRIVAKGDSSETSADRRNTGETELLEDGFISVRKKSCRRANDENMVRFTNGVKPMINHDNDGHIVRKVLSEISNTHYQNTVGSTGKWSCPQKNKPDLGPPLKQLRLDQWVRRRL